MSRRRPPEEEAPYRPTVDEIARRHRLAGSPRRYPDGACPVFAVGDDHVVKLFAAPDAAAFANERAVLAYLEGKLGVPTPSVRAAGQLDDWWYLVLSRLPGRTLRDAWPAIPRAAQVELAAAVGELLAGLHALPATRDAPAVARPDWCGFFAQRVRECIAFQAAQGAPDAWLARLTPFLAGFDPAVAGAEALLHTEVMREHVLVDAPRGRWQITGLVDFEPAAIGPIDYEFAAVGLFVTEGDAELLRSLLLAYGARPDQLDAELRRRFLAFALLHRYSNLAWFLDRLPPRPGVTTFEQLADQWFAT